jgi:hypothetical protein
MTEASLSIPVSSAMWQIQLNWMVSGGLSISNNYIYYTTFEMIRGGRNNSYCFFMYVVPSEETIPGSPIEMNPTSRQIDTTSLIFVRIES